jgi:predicted enzyme related to lactoylglutathione lyase
MPPEAAGVPSHCLVYFAVADVDASAEKAKTLGGKWMVPPSDIPGAGRLAVLQDPQGAVFAILTFAAP